jgi:sigma-70-like protein
VVSGQRRSPIQEYRMSEWSRSENATALTTFHAALAREQQALRGFVHGMVGDAEQARDIAQDVFLIAWQAAKEGASPFIPDADERSIRRWLYCVAYRRAISLKPHDIAADVRPLEVDHLVAIRFRWRTQASELMMRLGDRVTPSCGTFFVWPA